MTKVKLEGPDGITMWVWVECPNQSCRQLQELLIDTDIESSDCELFVNYDNYEDCGVGVRVRQRCRYCSEDVEYTWVQTSFDEEKT